MSSETVSFEQKRGTRSFHVEGPKTEKAREAAVQSLVGEIWRIRVPNPLPSSRFSTSPSKRSRDTASPIKHVWEDFTTGL